MLAATLLFVTVVFVQGLWNPFFSQHIKRPAVFAMSQQQASTELVANVQIAIEHHKNGNIEEAIVYYEKVLPQLAGNTKASLSGNVGALYMSKGEYERAKVHFLASVEADPNNPSAHFNLAVVLTTKLGEHGKAIKHCGKAINLDPNNHKAHHLMGNIMQSIGRPDEASKYFVAAESIAMQSSQTAESTQQDTEPGKSGLANLALFGATTGDSFDVMLGCASYTVECVSESPLVFIVDGLITEEECNHIKNRASKLLEKSYVMGGDYENHNQEGGATELDTTEEVDPSLYRSSYNAWLSQDSILNALQLRVAAVLGLPAAYLKQKSEELQVVRYAPGGQFKAHQDSSAFSSRLVTALLYLNDIAGASVGSAVGGETWFPFAGEGSLRDWTDVDATASLSPPELVERAVSTALGVYEQCSADFTHSAGAVLPGLKVTPKLGRAVLFFNHLSSGAIDPKAVHAGLPIRLLDSQDSSAQKAEKWVANYWVEYDPKLLSELVK